ncbi:MAG: marine proteobacterial sortase target protein, partial [Woeseiales bacterium]
MSNAWAARNSRHTLRIADGKSTWHPRVRPETAERLPRILRRRARRSWLTAITLSLLTSLASAQVADDEVASTSPGQMQAGSLLLKMKSGYAVATRLSTDISAEISGLAARVRVKQEFRNSSSEWVEGVYVFPLPDTAAVDRLRMYIGERYIEGEIREKAEAKKAYEAAKAAGKKASLVQQERANMFTTSVANIAPGETVVIEIEYLETLQVDAEMFSIRFPVTITPRYIPGTPVPGRRGSGWSLDTDQVADASRITPPTQAVTKEHKLSFNVILNSAEPLEYIASRYHPVNVNRKEDQYAIDLVDSDTPMDHDIELTWKAVPAAAPRAMLFTENADDETYALMMLLPPDVTSAEPQTHTARELILIIDTSGSMHGTSIEQAQRALTLALDGLQPTDQFNVIQFNSSTSALFRNSVAASTTNVATAKRYVSALTANGGTEMRSAIERAMAVPPNEEHLRQIIFITDGSVGNEDALFSLIEQQLGNARLFTVGIGSAPNSWFMRKAAEAGRGAFTFISALHEVSEKMQRLFRKIERPQITDITIQW